MHFLLLAFSFLSAEVPPMAGTLCFDGGRNCSASRGVVIEVEPQPSPRLYVWRSADERTLVVGELAADAERIELPLSGEEAESSEYRRIRLSLRGEASRGWPADVRFMLSESRERNWGWLLPAASARGEIIIHAPAGGYRLDIGADRHRLEMRRFRLESDVSLREIALRPLPAFRGRITRVEKEDVVPATDAQILAGGKLQASPNEQGHFAFEMTEPVAGELLVTSPGLGSRVVLLENPGAENDLGEIRLEAGWKLSLEVERAEDVLEQALEVKLLRNNERRHEHSLITRTEIGPHEESVELSDLARGDYFVLFGGKGELERLVVPVSIADADREEKVEIRPYRLQGTALIGDEPAGEGSVEISPARLGTTWRGKLEVDSEGHFGAVLWQPGILWGALTSAAFAGGLLYAESPELGSDPSAWPLAFRKRLIHGRVYDDETGAAVERVGFQLQTTTETEGRSYSSLKLRPDGSYEILAWQNGIYDLILNTDEYLPVTRIVELGDADGDQRIDIALERGTSVKLEVVWSTGQPVAGAGVLEGVARDGHNPERMHSTDAAGRLTLRAGRNETRTLYVVPREGSLAIVRLAPGPGKMDEPVRIEVPPPAGTLRVLLEDSAGEPAFGALVMRLNGEWIPHPVSGRIRGTRSLGSVELIGLPAGVYELWAIRPSGRQPVPNYPPPHQPVRAGVATGETTVKLQVVEWP